MKKLFFSVLMCFVFFTISAQDDSDSISQKKSVLRKQLANTEDVQIRAQTQLELAKIYLQDSSFSAEGLLNKIIDEKAKSKFPDAYLLLGEIYIQRHQLDTISYFLNLAEQQALQQDRKKLLAKIYYKQGDVGYYTNHYKTSEKLYRRAIHQAEIVGDYSLKADILTDLAYIYIVWSDKNQALQKLDEALKLSDSIGYIKGKARASLALGNIYHGLEKHQQSLTYYRKTLQAAKQINNLQGMGIAYGNIGMSYLELHQDSLAISNLKQSIKYSHDAGSYLSESNAYMDLGIIFARQGKGKLALNYADKGISLTEKFGSKEDISQALNSKAEALSHLHDYKLSNRYLDKSIAMAKQIGYGLLLQKSYYSYAENLKKMGDYHSAFNYMEKYVQVKDSIDQEKFHKQLAHFETKYKTLEKQKEIEDLQHQKALQKAHFNLLLISSIALLLLSFGLFYIIIQRRKKRRKIMHLELEKSQIEAKRLAEQLALKNKQLTTHALNMMQKNQLLMAFSNAITNIVEASEGIVKKQLKSLKNKVNRLINSEKDWDAFKIFFEQVNKDFLKNIKALSPELTQSDLRMATLLKLNMSNKEIASILNITYQSVKNAQNRLKNKLNLPHDVDLRNYINEL